MTTGVILQVDIEKYLNGEYWTNRYYITATSISGAVPIANAIASREQGIHSNVVQFTKARVSTPAPNDNQYTIIPLNFNGTNPDNSGLLPLFNVLRIDFPSGFGRPYRKLFRGCLTEQNTTAGLIVDSAFGALVSNYTLNMDGEITDREGIVLGRGVLFPRAQMRQLRRGTKRRQTPILPVS